MMYFQKPYTPDNILNQCAYINIVIYIWKFVLTQTFSMIVSKYPKSLKVLFMLQSVKHQLVKHHLNQVISIKNPFKYLRIISLLSYDQLMNSPSIPVKFWDFLKE